MLLAPVSCNPRTRGSRPTDVSRTYTALHALHGYTVSIMKSPGPDGRILTENNDALTCLAYVGNDPYAPSSTRSAQLRMYTTARKGPPDTFHIT